MSTLSPHAWEAASTYLDHALSLPDEKRAPWLVSLRQLDPRLASHLGPAPPLSAQAPMAGQTIGSYSLVSLIGEDGTGSV
jgi:hypothetical protein